MGSKTVHYGSLVGSISRNFFASLCPDSAHRLYLRYSKNLSGFKQTASPIIAVGNLCKLCTDGWGVVLVIIQASTWLRCKRAWPGVLQIFTRKFLKAISRQTLIKSSKDRPRILPFDIPRKPAANILAKSLEDLDLDISPKLYSSIRCPKTKTTEPQTPKTPKFSKLSKPPLPQP